MINKELRAPIADERVAEDTEVQRVKSIGPAYPYTPNTARPTPLASAPVVGEAQDLTLTQQYEDACILANANARDAARWRAYAAQFPEISAAFLAVHGDAAPQASTVFEEAQQ